MVTEVKMRTMAMTKEKVGNSRGFTLIEVLTVVGIISILTILAIPATRMVEKAVLEAGAAKGLNVLQGAFELYYREMGMYPVSTEEHSRIFFREIDRFLPDTYYIRHSENYFIRGYRLFAWGFAPAGQGTPGGGALGTSHDGWTGGVPPRWGAQNYTLEAVPIENHLGLSTFYIDPGGVITIVKEDGSIVPY
jgi:prepilin-type N-terminal cleavage/methylation domain-containing protein